MQFWCSSSAGVAWSWAWRPYLGVWILLAVIAGVYFWRLRRYEPAHTNADCQAAKRRMTFFVAALCCLWLALDWPVAALGAGYLASVHMVQYLLIALVVPPLLLLSIPPAAYQRLNAMPRVMTLLHNTTQPLIAFFIFNLVISVVHWPSLVDIFMSSQLGAFALDMTR
jgi:putative membrane protein